MLQHENKKNIIPLEVASQSGTLPCGPVSCNADAVSHSQSQLYILFLGGDAKNAFPIFTHAEHLMPV